MAWSKYGYYSEPDWCSRGFREGRCSRLQHECMNACRGHHSSECYKGCSYDEEWHRPYVWYEFAKQWCKQSGVKDLTGYCFEFDELSAKLYPGQPKHIGFSTCQIVPLGRNMTISNTQRPRVEWFNGGTRRVQVEYRGSRKFESVRECWEWLRDHNIEVSLSLVSSQWLQGKSNTYRKYGIKGIHYLD